MKILREKPLNRLVIMASDELIAWLDEAAEVRACTVSEVVCDLIMGNLFDGQWKGIGDVARKAILSHKTNEEALADVLKVFPKAATSTRSISWYRTQLRKEHPNVPVDAQIKRLRKLAKAR